MASMVHVLIERSGELKDVLSLLVRVNAAVPVRHTNDTVRAVLNGDEVVRCHRPSVLHQNVQLSGRTQCIKVLNERFDDATWAPAVGGWGGQVCTVVESITSGAAWT